MREPLSIGIVGGMSPESTIAYYRRIIRRHEAERRDHSYPRIVIASVSFQQYIDWQHAASWDRVTEGLAKEFQAVAAAGADVIVLATNTMHKVLPGIVSSVPVLQIFDAVRDAARVAGVHRVGLTGTAFTMSDGFYQRELEERGLAVVLPTPEEQAEIHRMIYEELIVGQVVPTSAVRFATICSHLAERDAEAVLLACTELELLTHNGALPLPDLDTTKIHADAAWEVAVGRRSLP